ncbi:MAG: efflux RND transporter periplasmic adaptor subunit [Pseudomonadota bacterium]
MTAQTNDTETQTPGLLRRLGRTLFRFGLTLGVLAVAGLGVQLGSQELMRRADAAPAPQAAPVMPVETAPIVLVPAYEVTRSFVGQIEAQRTAAISFELSGRLNAILVDEGDAILSGQKIATLDTRLLDADRDRLLASQSALDAQLRFAKQTVTRQSRLSDQGFASQAALDEALSRVDELSARIAEVQAGLMSNTIQAEKSTLFAPFAGRVTERRVDGGESVGPGQTLIEIVEDGAPHLRVGVPLDIAETDLATAKVEIDGTPFEATLVTLRPDVDPVTRTRTAIFEIASETRLAFGQTAQLRLTDMVETEGLWVPITTLKEGLRGQWTLLGVDGADTVRALSVQVIHTQGDQVFVRGAFPEDARLITAGPQRVTVGQTVNPQPAY